MSYRPGSSFCQPLLDNQYPQDLGIGNSSLNLPLQDITKLPAVLATSSYNSSPSYDSSTTTSNPSPYSNSSNGNPSPNNQVYGNTSPPYTTQQGNLSPQYSTHQQQGKVSPQYNSQQQIKLSPSYQEQQYHHHTAPSCDGNVSSPYATSDATNYQLSPPSMADIKPQLQDETQAYLSNIDTYNSTLPYDLQTTQMGVHDNVFRMNNSQYNNQLNKKLSGTNNFPVSLEYKKWQSKLYKVQKRARGTSQQRIENSILELLIDFQDVVTMNLVKCIQVFVKRSNEVRNTPQYVGPVKLNPTFDIQQNTKEKDTSQNVDVQNQYLIKVDLDSVYEYNNKKVYSLQKTLTDELNTFHLIISVTLEDGRHTEIPTKEILLVGKKTGNNAGAGTKRPANNTRRCSQSSDCSMEPLCKAPSYSSGYVTANEDEDVFRARKIVTTHIETKSMEVDGILVNSIIQTPHGDIAYHFPLRDGRTTFEEGEVVGLLHDSIKNRLEIVKLTAKNADEAVLKGVITRSQYLEAMKPADERTPSETICMLGVVPVKFQGSCEVNEAFYASPDHDGVATSQFNLTYKQMSDASLIGYAFQSHTAQSEDEITMVQAGVSVLSCASQCLLNKRLRDMEKKWTNNITKLKKANQRFRRCFLWCAILSIILGVLLGIFLWQLLVPGSAYRYYICKKGSIAGHTSYFKYKPGYRIFNSYAVNGIEFTYEDLMKKTHHDYKRLNITDARYYLNIDVCAYGGQRSTRDATTGQGRVSGPVFYAVDGQCEKVYSIFGGLSKWMDYSEISWPAKQIINVTCIP